MIKAVCKGDVVVDDHFAFRIPKGFDRVPVGQSGRVVDVPAGIYRGSLFRSRFLSGQYVGFLCGSDVVYLYSFSVELLTPLEQLAEVAE